MPLAELAVSQVLRVPDVIGGTVQIGCPFCDGVFVEAVEARLVHQIDRSLLGIPDGQRRVGSRHLSVRLHTEHRTEVDALLWVACGVASLCELVAGSLHLVGHLYRQRQSAVDVARQPDGNEFVGMRGKIFARDGSPVTYVTVLNRCAVEAQRAPVAANRSRVQVLNVQRSQGLVELRVRALHVQLQRVGSLVVLTEQRLADFGNPPVSVLVHVFVYGLARPQRDVVQVNRVVVRAAIDQCS